MNAKAEFNDSNPKTSRQKISEKYNDMKTGKFSNLFEVNKQDVKDYTKTALMEQLELSVVFATYEHDKSHV